MSQDELPKEEVQKDEEVVDEDVDGGGLDEEDEEEVLTLKSSDNKTFQVKTYRGQTVHTYRNRVERRREGQGNRSAQSEIRHLGTDRGILGTS